MTVRRPLAAVLAISLVSFGVLRCNFRQRPRNVVLVCIDTVRYDTWRLAERNGWRDAMREWEDRAIRFDRMQSAAPWTIPSVATVLTGMYPLRHGSGRFRSTVADVDRMRPTVLRPEIDTLPEKLAAAGWNTSAILAPSWVNEPTGLLQGVSEIKTVPESEVTAHAIEWLRKDRSAKPFFLYLHYMEAHGDQTPEVEQKMAASFSPAERQAVLRGMPANLCGDPANLHCDQYLAYARSVLDLRNQLAKLMDGIRAASRLDDTLVVIFSDHGEEFGEHFEEEKALANDPRREYGYGHGRSLYQELLHVPVLIWHPHAGSRTIASPVSLADIEPSIVEWTGVKTQSIAPDGVSFADIRSVDRNFDPERPLFFSGIGYGPEQTGVLWNQWKHISISCPKQEISFRLENDPLEKKPIAATRLDQKIAGLLDAYRALAGSDMREASLSKEQVASLQAIGYLRGGAAAAAEPDVSCSPAASHDSIGAFDPKSRTLYLRHKNTPGVADTILKVPGNGIPVFGDWNGGGISTLALFDPARSQFAIYPTNLALSPEKTIELGLPRHDSRDVPLAGDWNGDRVQTIGVYRPSTSTFYLRNHNTSGPPDLVIRFGEPGDKPVVGDWDGAGKTEIGVYRSSAATFLLRKGLGADQGFTPIVFGIAGDLPLAGDWNGDGTDTIGLYRPSAATFFLRDRNETGQADLAVAFGTPQFLPLAGNWGR